MIEPTKEEWDKAVGFLMSAFNAPEFEDEDDEVNRSWKSIAYHMIEYSEKENIKLKELLQKWLDAMRYKYSTIEVIEETLKLLQMIEKSFEPLYTLDSRGKIRVFDCHVLYTASDIPTISTSTGLLGGKMVSKLTRVSKGKNEGKANERNPLAQAFLEAESLWKAKLDEGYKSWNQLKAKYNSECIGLDSKFEDNDNNDAEPRVRHLLNRYPEAAQTNANWDYLPMLATPIKKIKTLEFPYYCQPKLNGVRCMVRSTGERSVKLISRGGTYYQIPHLESQLVTLYQSLNYPNILLDGELFKHGASLQDISGAARTEETGMFASNDWLEYHIFDVIYLDGEPETEEKREVNRLAMGIAIENVGVNKIKMVRSLKVLDETEIQECHDQFLEEGYEGAILRHMGNTYDFNVRSKGLIKVKSFIDEEFEIVGYSIGDNNIGESFVFILRNNLLGAKNTFEARPTGTIAQKEEWYRNIMNLQGKKATVRFQERSKDGLPIQGHVRSELTEVLHIRPDNE